MKRKIKPILPFVYSAVTSFPFSEFDFDALTDYELIQAFIFKLNEVINAINAGEIPGGDSDRPYYVPEDFGGIGNGVVDDTTAFDAAARAMNTGTVKTLYIPAGKTYLIKNTIAFPAGAVVFGAGETSRIYYDETTTAFGAGFTNGGDGVMFANFRIDTATTTPILVSGSMPSAIAIGCVDHVGEMVPPVSQYARVARKNAVVSNIYCNSRYAVQTENPDGVALDNVFVSDIFAPNSAVSIGVRGGKNIHYKNINCEMLRVGSTSSYSGYALTVDGFKTTFIRAFGTGAKISNGVVDCSDARPVALVYSAETMSAPTSAADIAPGNILENVNFIGGDDEITTCIRANAPEGSTERIEFFDCDFGVFETFWTNADKITNADFYGCRGAQNGNHLTVIEGGVYGGNMSGAITSVRSPLSFVNIARSTPDLSFYGTALNTAKVSVQNYRLYVKYSGSLPSDGILATVANDNTARFITNEIGDALTIVLYNGSTGAMRPAYATFTVTGSGTERTATLAITGTIDLTPYTDYYIDSSVAIGTISD